MGILGIDPNRRIDFGNVYPAAIFYLRFHPGKSSKEHLKLGEKANVEI